jgi:hypothetical protein
MWLLPQRGSNPQNGTDIHPTKSVLGGFMANKIYGIGWEGTPEIISSGGGAGGNGWLVGW